MDEMKSGSVVLLLSSEDKDQWTNAPKVVQDAIRSPESGRFIPKLIVLDSSATNLVGVVGYHDLKDSRALNVVKRKLKATKSQASALSASQPAVSTAQMEAWTSTEGKSVTAAFVSGTSTSITLKLQNGGEAVVPIQKLNADSQKRARELMTK